MIIIGYGIIKSRELFFTNWKNLPAEPSEEKNLIDFGYYNSLILSHFYYIKILRKKQMFYPL